MDLTPAIPDRPVELPDRLRALGAYLLVAGVVCFNLVELRHETTPVAYLNDGAMHVEMVRFATAQLRAGHLPLTAWFPFLGEGSPQFLHYQSLGATLTGALGLALGPDRAYAWVLYLVLSTWPVSVFSGARLAGLDRYSAAFSAVVSPLVVSVVGVGYEQRSYLTSGYGLWSQLLAMWTLPLAWGLCARATESRRAVAPAALLVALTIGLHFLTGYLALLGVATAFVTASSPVAGRLRRLGGLTGAIVVLSAWVVVPLLWFREYAAINEFLQHGPDVNSYGARQVLAWLFTGQLFDQGRVVLVTPLVLGGLGVLAWRARSDASARNLLALFTGSLVLFFGRTTLGPLTRAIPGSADLFFRRFLMGVQLTGILAAGVAIRSAGGAGARLVGSLAARGAGGDPEAAPAPGARRARLRPTGALVACGLAAVAAYLYPCFAQVARVAAADAADIAYQQTADRTQGRAIAPLIAEIERAGGRVYAGLPVEPSQVGGWGSTFTVGEVPVFKYLADLSVNEVGFTLRTASLMTDPEVYFDEQIPADYPLFGVRWLLYPVGRRPVVPAVRVATSGPYALWRLPTSGEVQVVDTVGSLQADRADIGRRTAGFVRSNLAASGRYLTIGFAGRPAPAPTLGPADTPRGPAGRVLASSVALATAGSASATVVANRTSVVVLKASFDPGWTVTVDGRARPTEMIAPAYVGVVVPPGRHRVVFTYERWPVEGPLLWLAGLGCACLVIDRMLDRVRTAGSVRTRK